ncbi:cell division protein ZipA [Alcanivorax quisquiliarum]|uniref:Cell division protein ZipA n=1 Tax=Alcanivorax quisquiliarum TaxID=2933565 RepID=A0ABT0E9C1_9GAMM|nr:cell division protein ZipA [Alcanivorax quisquiliarum]MCK0538430.1 cell division protein ZipA [Alcanivorax quisquiliarum]
MGLNLETLVGILVILILLIMADGLRRMLRERNTRLRMKLKPRRSHTEESDTASSADFNPELPSGGARVVQRILAQRAAEEADGEAASGQRVRAEARDTVRATQQALFDEESLPDQPLTPRGPDADLAENEAELPRMRAERELPADAAPAPASPTPAPATPRPAPVARTPAPRAARRAEPARAEPTREPPPLLEVIVVHLIAPRGQRFDGRELLQALLENGMRFGEMNIFHCHRNEGGREVLQFSMANAVEPGTFDIDQMDREQFAGITFFLKLPGPGRPLAALERMLDTVRALAEQLGGELKDEQRSVLTPQTMEHMRQRVQEFERRLRLKAEL